MCSRCGCISEPAPGQPVRPAVVEGLLEAAILALLVEDGPMHGYALATSAVSRGLVQATVSPPRVYEALARLEDAGAVISDKIDGSAGPDRRAYHVTDAGRARLGRWMESLRLAQEHLSSTLTLVHGVTTALAESQPQ